MQVCVKNARTVSDGYHFGQSLDELGSKISTGVLLPNFTKKMLLNLLGLE